jgi:hypothetical protein
MCGRRPSGISPSEMDLRNLLISLESWEERTITLFIHWFQSAVRGFWKGIWDYRYIEGAIA